MLSGSVGGQYFSGLPANELATFRATTSGPAHLTAKQSYSNCSALLHHRSGVHTVLLCRTGCEWNSLELIDLAASRPADVFPDCDRTLPLAEYIHPADRDREQHSATRSSERTDGRVVTREMWRHCAAIA